MRFNEIKSMKIAFVILGWMALFSVYLATRYTFVPAASNIPVIFRCERWTGRVWIGHSASDMPMRWTEIPEAIVEKGTE